MGDQGAARTSVVDPDDGPSFNAVPAPAHAPSFPPGVATTANISPEARLGLGVVIEPGAFVGAAVQLADGVTIGPNATLADDSILGGAPTQRTVVHEGARIEANATILPGVTIGSGAIVRAGAVVDTDVPPEAIVSGNPAGISGWNSSNTATTRQLVDPDTLAVDGAREPTGLAQLITTMPTVQDLRGSLVYAQVGDHLPFVVQRVFLVLDVPNREVRGQHAHHELHQFLICIQGSCRVVLDDGTTRNEVVLDRPEIGVHIPPMVWGTQYDFSPRAKLLVLASDAYDEEDYIRDYDEFRRLILGG